MTYLNARAHALQLRRVHESIFENSLSDFGSPVRLGHQSHVLRLHIGGKAGILLSLQVRGAYSIATTDVQRALIDLFDVDANVAQLRDHAITVFRIAVPDFQSAPGDCRGDDERSRLNTIRNDGVLRAT